MKIIKLQVIIGMVCCVFFVSAYAEEITRGDIATLGSSSTVMTINRSGTYPLTSNYTGQILVTASNVTLDMQGFVITGGTYGVRITGNNCTVQNGTITGAQVGVRIESNNNDIINLDLVANGTGLQIVSGNNNVVDNCRALQNTSAGFSLSTAQNNTFVNCSAIGNGSNAYAYGFISQSGVGNTFEKCIAENTATTGSSPFYAAGFVLTGTEQKSNVINSIALNASGVSNYGMLISGTVAQYNVLKDNQIAGNVIGVRDDYAFTSSASTNLWMGNLGSNNTTNFDIGTQYPISAASGTGVGVTENIDAALTTGGPAEKIERTIVDQVMTLTGPMAAKVAALAQYGITAITGATTLTSYKSYCLATDVSGTVMISTSSFITLDLNGHTVGSISASNSRFLVIRNGRVYPNSSSTDGLSFTTCGNILLQDLDVSGGQNGLIFTNANSLDSSLFAQNCTFNNNSAIGVQIVSGTAPNKPNDHYYYKCTAQNNTSHGFSVGCDGGRFHLCQAIDNGGKGFQVDSGTSNQDQYNLFIECTALNNTQAGFDMRLSTGNNVVGACYARGNSTNYAANTQFGNSQASTTLPAQYWANTFE